MSPEITASLEEYERGSIRVQYSGWVPESWEIPTYEAPKSDIDADVVVVGAGITGASAALASERVGDLMLPVERPCASNRQGPLNGRSGIS